MAELHGKTGGIYNSAALIRGVTLSFDNVTVQIRDSGNGFVTAGFVAGQKITVIGSVNNNNTFTIAAGGVAAGVLTLTGTPPVTTEAAGALVTVYLQPAGTAVAGFHSWEITKEADVAEATDFTDTGIKTYILGGSGWTGTAERNWHDDNDVWGGGAVGTPRWVRFFIKYVSSPAVGDPAYYYEGLSHVKVVNHKMSAADIIRQTFQFEGCGSLALVTRTTAWP